MATVSTSLNAPVEIVNFQSPAATSGDPSGAPLSRINVNYNGATTGVGATDVEDVTINITLPAGYFYRILSLTITFYGMDFTEADSWDDLQKKWLVTFPANRSYYTQMENIGRWGASNSFARYKQDLYAITWALPRETRDAATIPIETSSGVLGSTSAITCEIANPDNSIPSVALNVRMNALQYTIEEGNAYPLWSIGNLISA